jgi:amino acid permease
MDAIIDEESKLLPDRDRGRNDNDYGYHDDDDDPTDGETDTEETVSTELLLEDAHAKYNPKCIFEKDSYWGSGTASILNEITSLLKNIVGSGGLSLPAGIAAFGNHWTAIFPSIVVIFIMGIVNAYSFSLLGRVCHVTKSKTYGQAWDRTVGRRYGTQYNVYVDATVAIKSVLGAWSFSILMASTCTPLVKLGWKIWTGRHHDDTDGGGGNVTTTMLESESQDDSVDFVLRAQVLLVITIAVILPMCLLERIGSLVVCSAIGQIGTLVTIFTMIVRYFDGTYHEGGKFYNDLPTELRPKFGTDKGALAFFSPQSLLLVSILSTGYVAHYNAPKYFYELKDHTTGRFNVVVNWSFVLAAITYMTVSSLGFLTFGEASQGFILDNYAVSDPLATMARCGVALSIIFAYPLLQHGGRDGILTCLLGRHDHTIWEIHTVTIIFLAVVTTLAIYVSDLTFVLSFSGATMSSLIIYIFPPLMFGCLVKNCTCLGTYKTNFEVKESIAMMVFGGILGILGAIVTVARTFF